MDKRKKIRSKLNKRTIISGLAGVSVVGLVIKKLTSKKRKKNKQS